MNPSNTPRPAGRNQSKASSSKRGTPSKSFGSSRLDREFANMALMARRVQRSYVPVSRPRKSPAPISPSGPPQLGAVVRSRITPTGLSDIRGHRMSWVAGYVYVGNGTNGAANSVYFQTASSTYLIIGNGGSISGSVTSSGQVPIAASDPDVGASYVTDIEKHFQRKLIKKLWIHVDSLQPSTANNMMCIIAPSRGPGAAARSIPAALATAVVPSNTVAGVASMKGAFTVDSWESKTVDFTDYIAGGAGAAQCEFEIGLANAEGDSSLYATGALGTPLGTVAQLIPACFAVAGNSTTAGLQGTRTHQITIECEVDLIDYVGALAQQAPSE